MLYTVLNPIHEPNKKMEENNFELIYSNNSS